MKYFAAETDSFGTSRVLVFDSKKARDTFVFKDVENREPVPAKKATAFAGRPPRPFWDEYWAVVEDLDYESCPGYLGHIEVEPAWTGAPRLYQRNEEE